MHKTLTLVFACILFCISPSLSAQITGSASVCAGSAYTYHTTIVPGGSYAWTQSGGNIQGSASADSLIVQWPNAGTGTISVAVTSPANVTTVYNLTVTVHPRPVPMISHLPYPGCPRDSGRGGSVQGEHADCEKVCKKATIIYSTPLHAEQQLSMVCDRPYGCIGHYH